MSEDKYQVIFDGSITEEYPLDITIRRFAKYFKISKVKAKQLFSGEPQIIKANLSEDAAMKLAMAIATIGCECILEVMPVETDLSKKKGFVEQRRIPDRRVKPRRKAVRGSTVKPDRRQNNGRRQTDQPPN
jgi:hypothetical protein